MKVIGLLGGMSWESSTLYYRIINEEIRRRLGGLHSGKIVLYSVDFHEIKKLQDQGNWEEAGRVLGEAAKSLQKAGAEFVVICTNTMHKVVFKVEAGVSIPILHIADATAADIRKAGVRSVGLLGTRFTMEDEFYVGRLRDKHKVEVVVPDEKARELVNNVIFEELCLGQIMEKSRYAYGKIIKKLVEEGAEGIILGCTEISMLLKDEDSPVPLFDTTKIHALKAVDLAVQ